MTVRDRRYGVVGGLAFKAPCRVATTANITLSGLQSIDGVSVAQDDRVLVKDQDDATGNGIWNADSGGWTRATDFNGSLDTVKGTMVLVVEGSSNQSTVWQLTTADAVIGTSELGFSATSAVALGIASAWMIANFLPAASQAAARSALGVYSSGEVDGLVGGLEGDIADLENEVGELAVMATTGDLKLTWKTTADTGWILHDDGTIGDASSGATTRANADTSALYALIWNNFADGQAAVSTGRGANAAADFAAHKTIALPKALGRAVGVAGAGSGLTSRTLGVTAGAETHTHTGTTGSNSGGISTANGGQSTPPSPHTHDFTTDAGSSMQPTAFWNVMIKL